MPPGGANDTDVGSNRRTLARVSLSFLAAGRQADNGIALPSFFPLLCGSFFCLLTLKGSEIVAIMTGR